MMFASPSYYGQFTDTGGLSTGDKVRIAGLDIGRVESLKIDGDQTALGRLLGLLDPPDPNFAIVTPL